MTEYVWVVVVWNDHSGMRIVGVYENETDADAAARAGRDPRWRKMKAVYNRSRFVLAGPV